MPRSRSRSIRSRYCARMARESTVCVSSSIRSASVDLPWSICATMQKFRMWEISVDTACPWYGLTCGDRPGPRYEIARGGHPTGVEVRGEPAGRLPSSYGKYQVSEEAQHPER